MMNMRQRHGVLWKEGFSQHEDPYGYKSHKRKKDRKADRIGKVERELAEMKRMMHQLSQGGGSQPQEDPTLDLNSQRRRSMASDVYALLFL
jgi:hypothetical protein